MSTPADPSSPAPTQRRRRTAISLRVLLLIVLGCGLGLGWVAHRARSQRMAVEAIEAYGGFVQYDWEYVNGTLTPGREPGAPRWLRRMLGDEYFQRVVEVNLVYGNSPAGARIDVANQSDAILARLDGMPGLERLLVHRGQASDESLRHVGKLRRLEELFIWDGNAVTDAGVAHLAGMPRLRSIHLSGSQLTDDGLAILARLPKIEDLSLQVNDFHDAGLAHLRGCPNLRELAVGLGNGRITDDGLVALADVPTLEFLDLQATAITDRGLDHLRRLPRLRELWISNTAVTPAALQALRRDVPTLKVVR